MNHNAHDHTRRDFLRATMLGGGALAMAAGPRSLFAKNDIAMKSASDFGQSRVALMKGEDRRANVIEALKAIEPQIRKGLEGKKRVLIKPNFVSTTVEHAAFQGPSAEGICEFLKPFFKGEILIGETAAGAPTEEGFQNFGYLELAKKYPVQLVNFDKEPHDYMTVIGANFTPRRVRVTKRVFDPDTYIISAAVMKTHDRIVATLSLKNLLVGSVIKDVGFKWGAGSKGRNDKPITHGDNTIRGINYNLFKMAETLRPDLSVIDGYRGMEGNGPVGGSPVDHKIVVASTDFLAADRVAVECMGVDFGKVGYLNFCHDAGLGQGDIAKLDIIGEKPSAVMRKYQLHSNVEKQYEWG